MKKKIIIGLSVLFLIICTSAISLAVNNVITENNKKKVPSDYKIGVAYEQAVKADKPILALFYVDWCGYCLRFMPKYKTVNTLYKNKFSVVMLNVEDPANKELVDDVRITGFPTLYILDPKYDNRVLLNNAYYLDLSKLRNELDRYLRIRKMLEAAEKCSK